MQTDFVEIQNWVINRITQSEQRIREIVQENINEAKQLTISKHKPLLDLVNSIDSNVGSIDDKVIDLYKTVKANKENADGEIKRLFKSLEDHLCESRDISSKTNKNSLSLEKYHESIEKQLSLIDSSINAKFQSWLDKIADESSSLESKLRSDTESKINGINLNFLQPLTKTEQMLRNTILELSQKVDGINEKHSNIGEDISSEIQMMKENYKQLKDDLITLDKLVIIHQWFAII